MIAEIIVDVLSSNVDRVYDYKMPDGFSLEVGCRVIVPFGKRIVEGFAIKIKESSGLPDEKLKSIIRKIDDSPLILPELIDLIHLMTGQYNIKLVDALRLFIPTELRTGKIKPLKKILCILNEKFDLEDYASHLRKNSFKQQALLQYLKEKKSEQQSILNQKFSASAVNKFKKDGVILINEIEAQRRPSEMLVANKKIKLTAEQERAIKAIGKFENKTFLLHGVTGSGKTEVYMNLIEKAVQAGKTAIMLVPEISLTPQVLGSFKARLGGTVALLHSGLSAGERFDEWRRLLLGEAKVVVGARSAVFAPLKNIGIIVIDEEHESSYNSESNPRYKTYEIASFRMKYNKCPLILGSATPSIKSYFEAMDNKSTLLEMPIRTNKKEMPKIQIVDMMQEIRSGNSNMFSRQLLNDLYDCLNKNEQALLFLNRRGFTSFMRCRECGYVAKCTDCDVSLVYHKAEERLKCHYCGKRFKALTICPQCKSSYIRQGAIGTQKVVDEIKKIFPQVKIFRMDNDTTRNKNAYQKILEEFSKNKPAILVGTQMIAKGHDFDAVSLVGIIDADQSLYQSNYQSTEKTFQLITQVSGRAGRKDGGGKIVLQTYNPRHYVYKFSANYNYKDFYEKEINIRQVTKFPPFSSLVRILISDEKEGVVRETTLEIFSKLIELKKQCEENFYYCNAMKSPHSKIKNKIRYQILLRFTKEKECDILKEIYKIVNDYKNLKASIFVEIDPTNLS